MAVCYLSLMLGVIVFAGVLPSSSSSDTRQFHFNVQWNEVRRLCHTKPLLTVNGKYPGPTIAVNEGDNVEIKVTNSVDINTTVHWHGIKQLRTGWADGPAYVTQCPIRRGQSYTYMFSVTQQRGTLFWHAHHSWQRASVYGAFIIYPRFSYPFKSPSIHAEFPVIFGEWWNSDVHAVEKEMLDYGGGPNVSDAYTINGLPGPLYPCSQQDTLIQTVDQGKTYMLRIINAALNSELFFAVAHHTLTVVEIDAIYTKPFTIQAIMVAPGQTINVLLTASATRDQILQSSGMFVMAARPYLTSNMLRSLGSVDYPCNVPKIIDKRVITTISLNLQDCPPNQSCKGLYGKRFLASMNNQSFVRPSMSILECHYRKLAACSRSYNFPEKPPHAFNYTSVDPLTENMNAEFGTKLLAVPYGTRLEIVLQDTAFLNVENHPIHFHGHNFFIVGTGVGNFDASKDPKNYNLVDPPERNTVAVPSGGWAAIRINADNPGVWFVHCHLEAHTSWGLAAALVVKDGPLPSQRMIPPPLDLPAC
ncbi:Laccase [Bertholletia excelsa]